MGMRCLQSRPTREERGRADDLRRRPGFTSEVWHGAPRTSSRRDVTITPSPGQAEPHALPRPRPHCAQIYCTQRLSSCLFSRVVRIAEAKTPAAKAQLTASLAPASVRSGLSPRQRLDT